MHVGRSLPPAAAPFGLRELFSGIRGILAGPSELDRFRSELRDYFGVKHCYLVSSGKAALALILLALKELHPERDEVLVPAFTCYSVPASIHRAGLQVRLCDLDPETLDFDFAQLSSVLSRRTRGRILAVVPSHLFGIPADISEVRKRVDDYGISIVEDAAQAMGEVVGGRKIGTQGDVGFFSLGRGKALTAVEGGVIVTDRDDIAAALHRLAAGLPSYSARQIAALIVKAMALMILVHPLRYWIAQSMPFLKLGQTLFEPEFPMTTMSSFQAGLTVNWRDRLEELRIRRRQNVARWLVTLRAGHCPEARPRVSPSLSLLRFPLLVRNLEKKRLLLRAGKAAGLGIAEAYPDSINRIPGLDIPGAFPVAEGVARELVTLPTHQYVNANDVTAVAGLLSRALH